MTFRTAIGDGTGRLVKVRFQFPSSDPTAAGLEADSTWLLLNQRKKFAVLAFRDVQRDFEIETFEADMIFKERGPDSRDIP